MCFMGTAYAGHGCSLEPRDRRAPGKDCVWQRTGASVASDGQENQSTWLTCSWLILMLDLIVKDQKCKQCYLCEIYICKTVKEKRQVK